MRSYIRAGIVARFATAPFLLQWFHPDERQMLEFAHYHAHGRLHPFMEATEVHLRNQTLPSLLSWMIAALDRIGLQHPWAYLLVIQLLIGIVSWAAMVAVVEDFRRGDGLFGGGTAASRSLIADRLGWFLALFWAFPFLYSRQLLEAVSVPATLLLWVRLSQGRYRAAGFFAGLTSILRYPSALWSAGALLVATVRCMRERSPFLRPLLLASTGFVTAILIGGIADLLTYGKFLGSAPEYWGFNRPGGPVSGMFGHDSLIVYWRWFEYLFTPWLAPLFAALAVWGLMHSPWLLLFCAPYILGHLWTPHREPRFMLPLMPVLALAVAHSFTTTKGGARLGAFCAKLGPGPRKALASLAWVHILLNFVWYPMNAWAQWNSAQGSLIRAYSKIEEDPRPLLAFGDPPIDALIPPQSRWADSSCAWRRAPVIHAAPPGTGFWLLRESAPADCKAMDSSVLPRLSSGLWTRVLRTRAGILWSCPNEAMIELCPQGVAPNRPDEPLVEPLVPPR